MHRDLFRVSYIALTLVFYPLTYVHASNSEWLDGQPADVVYGQATFDTADTGILPTSLSYPDSITVDPATRKVFISDSGNNRVLRFASYEAVFSGAAAEAVLGQPDFETTTTDTSAEKMDNPTGIFFDHAGRLWVCDAGNFRVIRFDNAATIPSGSPANAVLGQEDLDAREYHNPPTAGSLVGPDSIVMETDGTLWVSDTADHRVLRYDAAAAKADGANADGVLGQEVFSTRSSATEVDQMDFPDALAVSPEGSLWVADSNNNRILRFDNAKSKANGADANAQIGHTNFTNKNVGDQPGDKLPGPSGLAYDVLTDSLFVSSRFYHRILVLENGATTSGGISAVAVLGQTTLAGTNTGLSEMNLNYPSNLAVGPNGKIYVADTTNNRALRFSSQTSSPDVVSDLTIGSYPGKQKGNGIINISGTGQKQKGKGIGKRPVKFFFNQENDGETIHPFFLSGTGKNKFFKVKYLSLSSPRGNVTAAFRVGSFSTESLDIGGKHRFQAKIKSTGKNAGKRKVYKGRITSQDPNQSAADVIRPLVLVKD